MTAPALPSIEWIEERYEHAGLNTGDPHLTCRRCGMRVDWITQHAVVRHGDTDVEVVRPKMREPIGGWNW